MRVGNLRDSRGTLKKREQRTDDADQMKTVARHDSLPRFAGAPQMFYNLGQRVASLRAVNQGMEVRALRALTECPATYLAEDASIDQTRKVVNDSSDRDRVLDHDSKLHVAIEGVVRQVRAADQRNVVHNGTFRMELSGATSEVPFPLRSRPVVEAHSAEGTSANARTASVVN